MQEITYIRMCSISIELMVEIVCWFTTTAATSIPDFEEFGETAITQKTPSQIGRKVASNWPKWQQGIRPVSTHRTSVAVIGLICHSLSIPSLGNRRHGDGRKKTKQIKTKTQSRQNANADGHSVTSGIRNEGNQRRRGGRRGYAVGQNRCASIPTGASCVCPITTIIWYTVGCKLDKFGEIAAGHLR